MSMSTGGNTGGPMSEINVTPLVDVMLVLLIIFMITAPLMSHSITIDLPITNPKTVDEEMKAPPMDLAVKQDGTMYLDDHLISESGLKAQFLVKAQNVPQPELQIRADKVTDWKVVKKIIGSAKDSGMVHVGFMTTGKE
jgi:biopolymer transport protein ExbD